MWNVRVSIFLVVSTLRQFLHHRSGETLKTSDRGRQLRSKCLCALLSFVFLFFFFLLKCRLSVNSVRQHVILTWQEGFSQYGNKTFVWLVFFWRGGGETVKRWFRLRRKNSEIKARCFVFFFKKTTQAETKDSNKNNTAITPSASSHHSGEACGAANTRRAYLQKTR